MVTFPEITRERFDAVLFDMDGVLTATATVHAAAWKQMFDHVPAALGRSARTRLHPFRQR